MMDWFYKHVVQVLLQKSGWHIQSGIMIFVSGQNFVISVTGSVIMMTQ